MRFPQPLLFLDGADHSRPKMCFLVLLAFRIRAAGKCFLQIGMHVKHDNVRHITEIDSVYLAFMLKTSDTVEQRKCQASLSTEGICIHLNIFHVFLLCQVDV